MKISSKIKNNQKLKVFAAFIIGVFIALFISEIILQILNVPSSPASGWLKCEEENPGQCNQLGFRGGEIKYSQDDFVVLLVGDSEVYAAARPLEEMPEKRMERFLKQHKKNVKVFTIGDMGYGQDQQYLALRKYYEKYRADLVLLMFSARTDIENNIFPTSGKNNTLKPTFWLEKDELYGPTEGWLEPVGPFLKLALLWKSYVGEIIGESRQKMWEKNVLPPPYKPLMHYEGEVDYSWQERWNKHPLTAFKGIESGREGPRNYLTPRCERRTYGINLTRKLFYRIKELTEENNGHFIIFKEERPREVQYMKTEKGYYLNGKYYVLSRRQYKDNLRELFNGFEHYRISLVMDNYKASSGDAHLSLQAFDKIFSDLSFEISRKKYFRVD